MNAPNQVMNTIMFDTPGVWQVHTQFEYLGEGIITQINAGYSNSINYKEDITVALETNDVIQRFVPCIFVNQQGTNSVTIVSTIEVNTGAIYGRCKYFYVRIA